MNSSSSKGIKLASIAAGFILPAIAPKAARHTAGGIYRTVAQTDPPRNPARADVGWKEALLWVALAGVAGAVARLVTRRSLPLIGLPSEGYDMGDEVDEVKD
jgi:hypothetical protein